MNESQDKLRTFKEELKNVVNRNPAVRLALQAVFDYADSAAVTKLFTAAATYGKKLSHEDVEKIVKALIKAKFIKNTRDAMSWLIKGDTPNFTKEDWESDEILKTLPRENNFDPEKIYNEILLSITQSGNTLGYSIPNLISKTQDTPLNNREQEMAIDGQDSMKLNIELDPIGTVNEKATYDPINPTVKSTFLDVPIKTQASKKVKIIIGALTMITMVAIVVTLLLIIANSGSSPVQPTSIGAVVTHSNKTILPPVSLNNPLATTVPSATAVFCYANAKAALDNTDHTDYNEAVKQALCAIASDSNFGPAYQLLGQAYYGAKDFKNAVIALDKAVELTPKNATTFRYLSLSLENLGNWVRAVETWTKYIDLQPKDDSGYYGRGTAYRNLSQITKACDDFKKADEFNSIRAKKDLAELGCYK